MTARRITLLFAFFFVIFVSLNQGLNQNVFASCWVVTSGGPGCPSGSSGTCSQNGTCNWIYNYYPSGGVCYYEENCCTTPPEASCGGPVASCPGTCDNSTCASNGNLNCNDFNGHQDWCLGTGSYSWPSTCSWNYSDNYTCSGRYCGGEASGNIPGHKNMTCASFSSGGYNASRDLCVASGCHYVPTFNSCNTNPVSACTNGTCQNQCGDTTSCGTLPSYQATYPVGGITINTLTPTLQWVANTTGIAYNNICISTDPNTCTTGNYNMGCPWSPGTADRSFTTPASLSPNTDYYWQIYGVSYDPQLQGKGNCPGGSFCSGCDHFRTVQPTCTISVSPSSVIMGVGQTRNLTASVTVTGGSLASVSWTPANPSVATATTPGNSTTVTGISAGTTTVTATANLSPGGSCTNSAPVSVVRSYFRTFGGDVTAKGKLVNTYLPAGQYISGRWKRD